MQSEYYDKLINLVKSDKKMSGVLISKIPENEKNELFLKYGIDHLPTILYCAGKNVGIPECLICNKKIKIKSSTKGYRKYCSKKCADSALGLNNKINNPIRNINRSIKIKNEIEETLIKAKDYYLNDNNTKNIREISELFGLKYHQLRRFLSENSLVRNDILSKKVNEKWHSDNKFLFDGTLESMINDGFSSKHIANKFNISPNAICVYAKKQELQWKSKSAYETKISEFLDSLNINYIKNDRTIISPKELDFYIPEFKLSIEINGEYWHSDIKKDKMYHLNKQQQCESEGIHLMQFFTHEIDEKWENVQNLIRTRLNLNGKIYARKTELRCVDKATTAKFLEKNHLQGNVNHSMSIGLFYKDELVCICTFGKPRFNKKYKLELLRFCNKHGYNVIGGLSKILSHLKNTSIISYSHRRLFNGNGYLKSGFKLSHRTEPGYFWYSSKFGVMSRYQTQKHKLNTELTENEYMRNQGFLKIYDCGQNVYTK